MPPDPRPDAPPADGVGPAVVEPGALGGAVAEPPASAAAADSADESTELLDWSDPTERTDLGEDEEPQERPSAGAGGDGAAGAAAAGGTGRPDAAAGDDAGDGAAGAESGRAESAAEESVWVRLGLTRPRLTGAGGMIGVLLALLGFTLVVQLKTSSADPTLAATRQDDLVRILSDLESQESRLRQEIGGLEDSQRQLTSGAEGRQAALDEATRRADELGILAGTLPARGPGLTIQFSAAASPIRASTLLDAVQELRGAGAEAMQISDRGGATVRVIASTYFLDAENGITVSGRRLIGPYTITVIGDPTTMRTALNIPGGVVASVNGDGGNVIVQEREVVDVVAVNAPTNLKHARPVS
ncbi:DUF881 domain-containing protein [Micromonospora sp. NPDC049559]|uniref:DUF881 domain-containing protein n=1 Tax=Micromonospora sp. NPDC049559 TaxID=3155923 RepID=UPI003414D6DA